MFFTKKYRDKIYVLEKGIASLVSIHQKKAEIYQEHIEKMNEDVKELTEAMNELKEKSDRIDEILEDYENFSIEKALAKKSDEPWAGLSISEVDSTTGRVGIKLDWNDKFQEHLKRSGIPGDTDDDRMSIWFASLVKELGEEIDEETARMHRDDL